MVPAEPSPTNPETGESVVPPGRWSSYRTMSEHVRPAAERVVEALGPPGGTLLDLGSGDGNGLGAADRAGWLPIGVDLSTPQLQSARTRVAVATLVRADVGRSPFRDRAASAAMSNFGVIFAADVATSLAEIARCVVPGGPFAMTAWTPDGWPEPCRAILTRHGGGQAPAFPVTLGEPTALAAALDRAGLDVRTVSSASLRWRAADAATLVEVLTNAAGGLRALRGRCETEGSWPAARAELVAEIETRCQSVGEQVVLDDEYLLATSTRR